MPDLKGCTMTEAERLDAMNRACEELLNPEWDNGVHNWGLTVHVDREGEESDAYYCTKCLCIKGFQKDDCVAIPRQFTSENSPRSLITELINCIGSVNLKKLNGYYEGWEPSMILETTAYHIVQGILKVTGKWNTDWD